MQGQPKPSSESEMNWALRYIVTPGYLKAMGIQLKRGRFFTNHDDNHSPLVVVIDEEFARKFFGREDPIGKRLELQDPGEVEIVGITSHVKQWGLDSDDKETLRAQLYRPLLQEDDKLISKIGLGVDVVMRAASSPASVFNEIRAVSANMDREQSAFGMETMNEVIAGTLAERRFSMILLSTFAGLALLLAVIGVYGVTSYSVGRRTNEIGLRMAIGAERGEILRLILREGMRLSLVGIGVGVAASLLLTRLLSDLLFGVSPHDPLTLTVVAVLLAAVAAAACWIPAARAMRVDPVVALRYE
jgi:predicted permease